MTPRLLTESALADYLSLPVAAVRKLTVGRVQIDGRVRFDRLAIDRHLDGERPAPPLSQPSNENASEADAALAAFIASHPDVTARRS